MNYSSRYEQVLAGEEPNIFSPHFSGGSLSDLGIYPIYAALAWFGKPKIVHHFAHKIITGVDGLGTIILQYENFEVTIQHGKIANSSLASEIYLVDGTLHLYKINDIQTVKFTKHNKESIDLDIPSKSHRMIDEAITFAEIINDSTNSNTLARYQELVTLAKEVNTILFDLRQQADIRFDSDK